MYALRCMLSSTNVGALGFSRVSLGVPCTSDGLVSLMRVKCGFWVLTQWHNDCTSMFCVVHMFGTEALQRGHCSDTGLVKALLTFLSDRQGHFPQQETVSSISMTAYCCTWRVMRNAKGCESEEKREDQGRRAGTSRPSFSSRAIHTAYKGRPEVLIDRSKMSKSQSSICDLQTHSQVGLADPQHGICDAFRAFAPRAPSPGPGGQGQAPRGRSP